MLFTLQQLSNLTKLSISLSLITKLARTALHYDKKFPTDDRLQLFADSLEEHFNNMVTKELEHSDMNKVSQLVSDFEPVLSSDDLEKLKADIVLVGLVQVSHSELKLSWCCIYWRKQGQCFRCCPFLLCYNVGKQVNTDNKHRALLYW